MRSLVQARVDGDSWDGLDFFACCILVILGSFLTGPALGRGKKGDALGPSLLRAPDPVHSLQPNNQLIINRSHVSEKNSYQVLYCGRHQPNFDSMDSSRNTSRRRFFFLCLFVPHSAPTPEARSMPSKLLVMATAVVAEFFYPLSISPSHSLMNQPISIPLDQRTAAR